MGERSSELGREGGRREWEETQIRGRICINIIKNYNYYTLSCMDINK